MMFYIYIDASQYDNISFSFFNFLNNALFFLQSTSVL